MNRKGDSKSVKIDSPSVRSDLARIAPPLARRERSSRAVVSSAPHRLAAGCRTLSEGGLLIGGAGSTNERLDKQQLRGVHPWHELVGFKDDRNSVCRDTALEKRHKIRYFGCLWKRPATGPTRRVSCPHLPIDFKLFRKVDPDGDWPPKNVPLASIVSLPPKGSQHMTSGIGCL